MLFISVVFLGLVILIICILQLHCLEEFVCLCAGKQKRFNPNEIIIFTTRGLIVLVEAIIFFYYNSKLLRYKVKTKYHVKSELTSVSLLWLAQRFAFFLFSIFWMCDSLNLQLQEDLLPFYISLLLDCTLLTLLLVVPLLRKEPPLRSHHS